MMPENSEPTMLILEPRRRGRPRVPEPQERLSTRLPSDRYDKLVKVANQQEKSVSAFVRDILLAQSFLKRR